MLWIGLSSSVTAATLAQHTPAFASGNSSQSRCGSAGVGSRPQAPWFCPPRGPLAELARTPTTRGDRKGPLQQNTSEAGGEKCKLGPELLLLPIVGRGCHKPSGTSGRRTEVKGKQGFPEKKDAWIVLSSSPLKKHTHTHTHINTRLAAGKR